MDTPRDQAITDLEELSDLLSEVGTSLAEQDLTTAREQWEQVQIKYSSLSADMTDVLKGDGDDEDD